MTKPRACAPMWPSVEPASGMKRGGGRSAAQSERPYTVSLRCSAAATAWPSTKAPAPKFVLQVGQVMATSQTEPKPASAQGGHADACSPVVMTGKTKRKEAIVRATIAATIEQSWPSRC